MMFLVKYIKIYFNINQNYEIISDKLIYKSLPCIGNQFLKKRTVRWVKIKQSIILLKSKAF